MMTVLHDIWGFLNNTRRCPGCKKYSSDTTAIYSIRHGLPWERLGYCDDLGFSIYRCPKCGALIHDDIDAVLSPDRADRANEWLRKKEGKHAEDESESE